MNIEIKSVKIKDSKPLIADETSYKFMDDLQLALEDCKEEAIKYISGEKVYKDPQLSLEFKAEESQEAI